MSLYRRFVTAVQVVMPFRVLTTSLIGGAMIYLFVLGVEQYILFILPAEYEGIEPHFADVCLNVMAGMFLVTYGMTRGETLYTHKGYLQWLETTPWTSRLPLPVCTPINLVWQDAVVVGCGMLLWWGEHVSVLYLPALFLAARGLCRLTTNARWSYKWGVLVPAALLLAIIPLYNDPPSVLTLTIVAELVATAALRRGVARFPLASACWKPHNGYLPVPSEHNSEVMTGWPLVDYAFSFHQRIALATHTKVAFAALLGWATFCALYHGSFDDDENIVCRMVVLIVGCVLASGRALMYCSRFDRPLNFWVRFVKLRWIVPGYDKVYLAPLAVVAIAAMVPLGVEWATGSIKLAMAVGVAAVVSSVLCLGPSLQQWRFLGHHDIRGFANRQTYMKI